MYWRDIRTTKKQKQKQKKNVVYAKKSSKAIKSKKNILFCVLYKM